MLGMGSGPDSLKLPAPFLVVFAAAVLAAILIETPSGAKPGAKPGALNDAVILVIRHAEKPAEGAGLAPAGEARAAAYAGYFRSYRVAGQPLALDQLFAAADSKESERPRLTLEPASKALGLAIDSRFEEQQVGKLAAAIRSLPPGRHILICWHHGEIPDLLRALGANPAQLIPAGKWPEAVFNWVIQLRYDAGGRLADARRIEEPF